MASYYNKVSGNLAPGEIALVEDINQIQTNISDSIKGLLNDLNDGNSYILGTNEYDFMLSAAPKRGSRYIDTMNVVDVTNEKWMPINRYTYKQEIKKSKSSLYSVIVKLRNLYTEAVDVDFELQDEHEHILGRSTVSVGAMTNSAEFEVVFDIDFVPTALGNDPEILESQDAKFLSLDKDTQYSNLGEEYEDYEDPNNASTGASKVYLVVKALNKNLYDLAVNGDEEIIITDETFMICADAEGKYAKGLQQSGDGGRIYEKTEYDLFFQDVYANGSTYLCTGGRAIVDGEPVVCLDTHVTVEGASGFGIVDSYVYMTSEGHLKSLNSDAFINANEKPTVDVAGNVLLIAIITTYPNDVKAPQINQNDENLMTRLRSHHERLRRLESKMNYQFDIGLPSRLKYTLGAKELVDEHPQSIIVDKDFDGKTTAAEMIEPGDKYFITVDSKGNFVIKSVEGDTLDIPVTLKGEQTTEKKSGVALAQTIVKSSGIVHNTKSGTISLDKASSKGSGIGTTEEEAKKTEFNPWDDDAANRPSGKTITPIEREYVIDGTDTKSTSKASEFPAITFYTKEAVELSGIQIPITKFKNMESYTLYIWKRQGPNNKTNNVSLKERVFKSEAISLKDAKEKDGYQILDEAITIKIKDPLKLENAQYVMVVVGKPKSGKGSVFVTSYKPENSKDFMIRYQGSHDASHFDLKERYNEIWYNGATFTGKVRKFNVAGIVESGEVVWTDVAPLNTVTVTGNMTAPSGSSIQIYGNAGSGWVLLQPNAATSMSGGGTSFKWMAKLLSNGDVSPRISYNKELKHALNFHLVRAPSKAGGYSDKDVCVTSKTFHPDDILKQYIGDQNLDVSKFGNYEFLRLWGSDTANTKLLIDISASNKRMTITPDYEEKVLKGTVETSTGSAPKSNQYDVFTEHYVDLSLEDFNSGSVDYSNYDPDLEYDEHNLRFKIDTDYAYNDDDIALYDQKNFKDKIKNATSEEAESADVITYDTGKQAYHFPKGYSPEKNETIFTIDSSDAPLDLTKYSGIKFQYELTNDAIGKDYEKSIIKGLALYISSANEAETPSNANDINKIKNCIEGADTLPETLNMDQKDLVNKYYGKIIKVTEEVNGVAYTIYYEYRLNSEGLYVRQQVHDLKSFNIFELPDLKFSKPKETNEIIVSIDTNESLMANVKEVGLIVLGEDKKFSITEECWLDPYNIKSVAKGYNKIYDGSTAFTKNEAIGLTKLTLDAVKQKNNDDVEEMLCRINIPYEELPTPGAMLGYINNTSTTKNFNHFSIQMASDFWLPKGILDINLCKKENGEDIAYTLSAPTLNYIFYVTTDEGDDYRGYKQAKDEDIPRLGYCHRCRQKPKTPSAAAYGTCTDDVPDPENEQVCPNKEETDFFAGNDLYPRKMQCHYEKAEDEDKITVLRKYDDEEEEIGQNDSPDKTNTLLAVLNTEEVTGGQKVVRVKEGKKESVKATLYISGEDERKPLRNKTITMEINNKKYEKITDENGQIFLTINLPTKRYPIKIYWMGDELYNHAYIGKHKKTVEGKETEVNDLIVYVQYYDETKKEWIDPKEDEEKPTTTSNEGEETPDEETIVLSIDGKADAGYPSGVLYLDISTNVERKIDTGKNIVIYLNETTEDKEKQKQKEPTNEDPVPTKKNNNENKMTYHGSFSGSITPESESDLPLGYFTFKDIKGASTSEDENTQFIWLKAKIQDPTSKEEKKITKYYLRAWANSKKDPAEHVGLWQPDDFANQEIPTIDPKNPSFPELSEIGIRKLEEAKYMPRMQIKKGKYEYKLQFKSAATTEASAEEMTIVPKITYYGKETDEEYDARTKKLPKVNFSQVYKKVSEEYDIKSISISTTKRFVEEVKKIRESSNYYAKGDESLKVVSLFIKNIFLHEAEHIPLVHPNVRFKFYNKNANEGTSPIVLDAPSIRKIGSVIEYK